MAYRLILLSGGDWQIKDTKARSNCWSKRASWIQGYFHWGLISVFYPWNSILNHWILFTQSFTLSLRGHPRLLEFCHWSFLLCTSCLTLLIINFSSCFLGRLWPSGPSCKYFFLFFTKKFIPAFSASFLRFPRDHPASLIIQKWNGSFSWQRFCLRKLQILK